jgi:hypothetical protein
MGKLVKKDGKFLKKDGKFVKTDNIAECSCCGDGPCPPGKYCTWIPPDPCSTGKCQPDRIDDNPFLESQCGDAPYDCRSEEACNQWYEQNPNPLCPCWVCENGELVDRPAYTADCTGWPGAKPEGVECPPPEPNCFFCDASFPDNIKPDNKPPEECLDQGGFLTLEEAQDACGPPPPVQCYCICVSEPAPGRCDAPGAYKSCQPVFYIDSLPEDERPEIVSGPFACDDCVAECIQPPPPPCEGQKQCGDWQANYDDEGNFLNCSRVCCTYDAECACNDDGLQPEFSPDQSLCPAAKENPLP